MSVMMQVRNVPDALAAELKARAAAERLSLSDFLVKLLQEYAGEPTLDEVLDRLTSRPRRDIGFAAADLLAEVRAE